MKSSIRSIVIAASVANFKDFTLDMAGSTTPLANVLTTYKKK